MAINLADQLFRDFSGPAIGRLAVLLGEPEDRLQAAAAGVAPALVAAVADKAATPQDLSDVVDLMTTSGFDGTVVRGLLGHLSDAEFSDLIARGTALPAAVLGPREAGVTTWLSSRSGVSAGAAASLMALAAPVLLDMIASTARHTGGFNAASIGTLLRSQAGFLRNRMPAGLAGLLGIGDLSQLGSVPQHPGVGPPPPPPARVARWVTWVAIFAVALLAWWWFADRAPSGTIDPRLAIVNDDGRVDCSAQVSNAAARETLRRAIREAFGQATQCEIIVDTHVRPLAWLASADRVVAAVKRPGSELQLDGATVRLGGWLSTEDRRAIFTDLRAVLSTNVTYAEAIDRAVEFTTESRRKALAALDTLDGHFTAEGFIAAMNLAVIDFAAGSAVVPAHAQGLITKAAAVLTEAPNGMAIEVSGHTDNLGDPALNFRLSEARANAVRLALIAAGVNGTALTARGYGDSQPVASNDTEHGRFRNRRISYTVAAK